MKTTVLRNDLVSLSADFFIARRNNRRILKSVYYNPGIRKDAIRFQIIEPAKPNHGKLNIRKNSL